jgi:acetyl esterase/lipase
LPSEALAQLVEMMRQGGPDLSAPPEQARAAFDAMVATLPAPPDAAFVEESLAGVPALRYGSADPAAPTLLYLHGGGYVVGNAWGYRGLVAALAEAAGMAAYAIDYRLAPEHPFPAAIDDSAAAFHALIDRGHDPNRIAIAGDSAGGGLTVATLLRLRETSMPMPGAAFLISPWADLACSGASMTGKAAADPSLTEAGLRRMAAHYLGRADADDPLASPIHADLAGLPPILIHVGTAEILLDDALRLAAAAGRDDVALTLEIWPGLIHVWHAFAFMLPEGAAAVAAAGAFLRERVTTAKVAA